MAKNDLEEYSTLLFYDQKMPGFQEQILKSNHCHLSIWCTSSIQLFISELQRASQLPGADVAISGSAQAYYDYVKALNDEIPVRIINAGEFGNDLLMRFHFCSTEIPIHNHRHETNKIGESVGPEAATRSAGFSGIVG